MKARAIVIISLLVPHLAFSQEPSATAPARRGVKHYIYLHTIQETGDHIAVVDDRAFSTVDGLKGYIATLSAGDRVVLELTCSAGNNPFCNAGS